MSESLKRTCLWGALFLISVLMVTGCGTPAHAQDPVVTPVPPTTMPTATQPSTAAQSVTEPASPSAAVLRARKLVVERLIPGGDPTELELNVPVDTHEGDEIRVRDIGRALLRFHDMFEVELYRGATVVPQKIRVDPDGYTFAVLKLMGDHMRAEQYENTNGLLMVETDYATITLSGPDSEVMVCHGEALTCIAAMNGEVEVEAQGRVVTLKRNEATYVLKDQAPEPVICSDQAEFRQWLDQKLSTEVEEVQALGALVQEWQQDSCPGKASSTGQEPGATTTAVPRPDSALACSVIARRLNLRDAPSTSHGHRIGLLRYGDHFEAAARNADGTWIEGHAQGSDQTGWVYARYVSCDGSIDDLPVSE